MLQVFYLDVYICCTDYTLMLQMYVSNVSTISNVCFKCFICMMHMLQWSYTYVAKRMFVNVSSVADVCCSKCFMLQVLHDQAREVGVDEGGLLGRSGPLMRGGPRMHA
jgi:hypothetical protein